MRLELWVNGQMKEDSKVRDGSHDVTTRSFLLFKRKAMPEIVHADNLNREWGIYVVIPSRMNNNNRHVDKSLYKRLPRFTMSKR